MRIQHNMMAIAANLANSNEVKKMGDRSERLSSGYRVNRAADDAAGLSISEKMRGQIRGLIRASHNAVDGISLLNVADGALQEVHSILHRVRELCVQAANDTNTSVDREAIKMEIDQMSAEVDRIGKDTEFNTIKVLQGGEVVTFSKGMVTEVTYSDHKGAIDAWQDTDPIKCGKHYPLPHTIDFGVIKSSADWDSLDGAGFSFQCTLGCGQMFTFVFDKNSSKIVDETPDAVIAYGGTANNKVFKVGTGKYKTGLDFIKDLEEFIKNIDGSGTNTHVGHDNQIKFEDAKLTVEGSMEGNEHTGWMVVGQPKVEEVENFGTYLTQGGNLNLQVGANTAQRIKVEIPHIDREALGMDLIEVDSYIDATVSIDFVDEMIDEISMYRAEIGATVNRLEHTRANNDNIAENLQSSESIIRDADMAEEFLQYSKHNILVEASSAMLAQANNSTNGILNLLR